MLHTAIILAGGYGTRLKSVVSDLPKPMAPVAGQPFLNYQLRYLKYFGIQHVVLSVGYLADKIQSEYGDNYEGLKISYAIEKEALGTGGGIRLAMQLVKEKEVLVLNGDSFFDVDLLHFYHQYQKEMCDVTLALRQVADASRYGTIRINTENKIIAFKEKSAIHEAGSINGGIYIVNTLTYLNNTEANKYFSIEKNFFEEKLKQINIRGHLYEGYFIDIGIPEDYQKAQHDFEGFKY